MEFRPRKVPVSHAWAWPREALELIARRPLEPAVLAILIGISTLLDIGSIGTAVALVLLAATPAFVGIVCVLAYRADTSRLEPMTVEQWSWLALLGVTLIMATVLMTFAIDAFSPTATSSSSTTRAFSQSWQVSPVAAVLGGLSIAAVFWPWPFTVALVARDDLGLPAAFGQTIDAMLLNVWSTFFVYAAFVAAFLLTMLSWPPLAGALFVFMAFTSYAAYRDIWHRRPRNKPVGAISMTHPSSA